MSLPPTRKKSITLILDVEDQTVQHLMNVQLIENFQNQDLEVALDLLINLNRTETVIGNEVRQELDQEEHVRDIEKSQDREQEVVQGDHELEVNLDLDIEVLLDLVRAPFQGLDLDPALVQKDLEVHLQAVYPDQSQDRDQDLSHITEVTQEIVIVEDIILHRNQYLNLDPELNLNLDLDQDQEVNPDANDLVVSKIKCQHCQDITADVGNHQVWN